MRKILLWLGAILILFPTAGCAKSQNPPVGGNDSSLALPTPLYDSQTSVEQALQARRSVRAYSLEPLTLAEVSQLLWAAQGLTHPDGLRTAPSAGALYPLDIYLLVGNVMGLPAGVYHYQPRDHTLILIGAGDKHQDLYEAALRQSPVKDAAIVFVISAVYERTTGKYGQRGIRYVHMEVGHAAQNVYLQAESLDLGTVFIGAFHEDEVKAILQMSEEETPLGLMPVGRKLHSDEETP
jgi:SagB-type dehydrogenase family enzyme